MTTNTKGTEQAGRRSGSTGFFIGLLRILLLLVFVAAGIFLGYLGWQQINYLNVVNQVQSERISRIDGEMILDSDIDNSIRANNQVVSDELQSLQSQINDLVDANDDLQTTLNEQAAVIDGLSAANADLDESISSLQAGSEALGNAVLTLQQDIASSTADLDSIGATIDGLANAVNTIDDEINDLAETVEAVADAPPAVAGDNAEDGETVVVTANPDMGLWRLWGLVMRTKIHMAENDLEAAGSALDSSLAAAETLAEDDEALSDIVTQLESAADEFTTKPASANRTLDEVLDALEAELN